MSWSVIYPALPLTFSFFEHIDYYEYLLKISWPALSGLFVICAFLCIRVYRSVRRNLTKNGFHNPILVISRLILTLVIVLIYFNMFFAGYGDWFSKPVVSRGIVQSIQEERGTAKQPYKLTLQNGEELITLYVDKNVEERLKKEDMIEVAYLPGKKEVFRCIVLTRQAENDI